MGLQRCAVVFEAADPPRTSTMAFFGAELPEGEYGDLAVAGPDGRVRSVPAVRLPVAEALPVLSKARRAPDAHPAAAFWGAAVVVALQLTARGRLMPSVTDGDFDAWRVGPLETADVDRVRELARAMPALARAAPLPDRAPVELADAETLVRGFLDAVADGMPRGAAAVHAVGAPAFAAVAPTKVPHLKSWVDQGVRLSLRIEAVRGDYAAFKAVVQVHSVADPSLVKDAAELWEGTGGRVLLDTTLAIRRAARAWAPLERLLDLATPSELALLDDDVADLLARGVIRLAGVGVDVHWPKELVQGLTSRAVLEDKAHDLPSFFGDGKVFGFDWQLALGDAPLTDAEMDRLAESHRPVVRLRDQWVLVDPEQARRARERALKPVTAIDALGAALTGTVEVDGEQVELAASGWLEALRQRIATPDEGTEPIGQPAALRATLRDYQLRGLRWLDRMTSLGLGGCLADDMGLGKTITLIALHLHRDSGPTLVVCPASLLGNWEREIRRFAPEVPVQRFHGGGRSVDDVTSGFVLTTYGTMRLDAARLGSVHWGLLVADEAQHVKNARSSTAKALRRIPADGRVALTGTPVENNLSELWAILDWTTPGLLGSLAAFRARWAKPIEGDQDQEVADRLARLVRPFLLRRRKSDPGIAPELPPKTETDQPVALTHEQAALYEATVRELMAEIAAGEGMARRGLIVKLLTGLKQICNHPAQYLKEGKPRLAGRSGKLELLDELLDTILAEGGSVLVFTQYVAMARLLERHLADRGVATQLLHGGTPVPKREELVRRFQDGEVPVFLLSLKAAGTGLNLTRADHVVHFDRWWNPAVEDQATDRAYRIGQTRPVQVHRLIAEGTVEDRIAEMLRAKRALADAVLSAGEAALTELSDAELADLVELRSGR